MAYLKPKAPVFRIIRWLAAGVIVLIALAIILPYAASGTLRRYLENNMNSHLKTYTVTIGKARLRPIGFSLHLHNLKIIQKAKPEPPVAFIPHLSAGVHWKDLLRARLVANFTINRPRIHFDIRNVEAEQKNKLPVKDEGWQQAAESIYPLKINLFRVLDADLTYIDQGSYKPLHMRQLNIVAGNIRNVWSPEHVYPSTIHLDGAIFEIGKISLNGNEPTVSTEIDRLTISNSDFGFVNKAAEVKYRLFISDTDINIGNISNQFLKGPAVLKLTGKFMGSGATEVSGTFRPEKEGSDFDLKIAIEQTRMKPMSDLFRAYGNFAIEAGLFSFYSELAIKEKTINGYVKPMFKDMDVTDKRTKDEKSLFQKLYVGIVEAITELLENPQEKVATRADISGPIEDPRTSTWQIIQRLIQNAFFRSILPGFSESIPRSEK